jgi:16S rRNA (cytosine1402-N4)-methyltransferase
MSPEATAHIPVMPDEVLANLQPGPGETLCDCTTGTGGHAILIRQAMQGTGTLIAMDRDPEMLERAKRRFREKGVECESIRWVVGSFADLDSHLAGLGIASIDGALFDFGLNTVQLDDPGRGFTFAAEGPLDARFSREEAVPTLADRLAVIAPKQLEEALRTFGDERYARRIARAIIRGRDEKPIETTTQLAEMIRRAVPGPRGRQRIDPATRSFQALRILVNLEMEHIERGLEQAIDRLAPGGRIVALSYHSGEDRLVKRIFRRHDVRGTDRAEDRVEEEKAVLEIVTRRPLRPTDAECHTNPRSRSARLRAARKIKAPPEG